MKYSDLIAAWLSSMGYTHFFSVGGGNIMHLTESLSRKLICIPVVNEVAAGIAVEYFNETSASGNKALALVTAGPGLTNMVTAIAGAFLESRELLVIGGQAKTVDLARGKLRQRGIQEIDGVSIVKPITVLSELIDVVLTVDQFSSKIRAGSAGRKGPVFLEIPLDIQGAKVDPEILGLVPKAIDEGLMPQVSAKAIAKVVEKFNQASRPVILLGGGISRKTASRLSRELADLGCPVMTTWNAADRIGSKQENYMGRPNT